MHMATIGKDGPTGTFQEGEGELGLVTLNATRAGNHPRATAPEVGLHAV